MEPIIKSISTTDLGKCEIAVFNSLADFKNYILNKPINAAYRYKSNDFSEQSSNDKSRSKVTHCKTKSFEEALNLLEHGWAEGSKEMEIKLKNNDLGETKKIISQLAPVGYQPVVPLAMMGLPNSMIKQNRVAQKNKIIDVMHGVQYGSNVKPSVIMDEGVKCLAIVRTLEKLGYRVNLYVSFMSIMGKKSFGAFVKIKGANERLNVSKAAFCLAHPSMLRRLFFAFMEKFPNVTKDFIWAYGYPVKRAAMSGLFKAMGKRYIYLPQYLGNVERYDAKNIEEFEVQLNMYGSDYRFLGRR